MHAYRRLVQAELDRRRWKPVDLVRASGLTKQTVSNLLGDTRDRITKLPDDRTIDGLVGAFGANVRPALMRSIAEALGLPVAETVVVYDASQVSNEELLRVLEQRLRVREDGGGHVDRSAPNTMPSPGGVPGHLAAVPDLAESTEPEEGKTDEPPPPAVPPASEPLAADDFREGRKETEYERRTRVQDEDAELGDDH